MMVIVTIISCILLHPITANFTYAQPTGNMTSTCNQQGECVTIICIGDLPCESIFSNATNSTGLGNFIENKTKALLLTREIA